MEMRNYIMEKVIIKNGIDEMDFEKVTQMLSEADWSPGIKNNEVKQGAYNSSLVIGAFLQDGTQIGYARVVSDKTRFAFILDVYVQETHRKKGVGQEMLNYIISHKKLEDVYIWMLITEDAHGVYRKVGFEPISHPENCMEIRKGRPER
jgi:GNAT superfamily N-acetyltransferase